MQCIHTTNPVIYTCIISNAKLIHPMHISCALQLSTFFHSTMCQREDYIHANLALLAAVVATILSDINPFADAFGLSAALYRNSWVYASMSLRLTSTGTSIPRLCTVDSIMLASDFLSVVAMYQYATTIASFCHVSPSLTQPGFDNGKMNKSEQKSVSAFLKVIAFRRTHAYIMQVDV